MSDRRSLLLGTALASTLLLGNLLAAAPVSAQVTCAPFVGTSPDPIFLATNTDPIDCQNDELRRSNAPGPMFGVAGAIQLITVGGDYDISLVNSGDLFADVNAGSAMGIFAATGPFGGYGTGSGDIFIVNSGDVLVNTDDLTAGMGLPAAGILALAWGPDSTVTIENHGTVDLSVGLSDSGKNVIGVGVTTFATNGVVDIENHSDVTVIVNQGESMLAGALGGVTALFAGGDSSTHVLNDGGDLKTTVIAGDYVNALGLFGATNGSYSTISLENRNGRIEVSNGDGQNARASGIYASAGLFMVPQPVAGSRIDINNSGSIEATAGDGDFARASGIFAGAYGVGNAIDIVNRGDIAASVGSGINSLASGIFAQINGGGGSVTILNEADIKATAAGGQAVGIGAVAQSADSPIDIVNRGSVVADNAGILGYGGGAISITNRGHVTSLGEPIVGLAPFPLSGVGIFAVAPGTGDAFIDNQGRAEAFGDEGWGIAGAAVGPGNRLTIINSGSAYGAGAGIATASNTGATIVNSGDISAGSHRAIYVIENQYVPGASIEIFNTGNITGFVELGSHDDTFLNQSGGVFETKLTSNFGGGNDLFRNEAGGTVLAATNSAVRETSAFVNLERFENSGLISMVDGREGDVFEISNTSPEARDLAFVASGDSTLAVDAFLGGEGSQADNFIINGNISGKTELEVNNTNPGVGAAGVVIPVVYANGNVKSDAFFLPQPIDTGFFNYDLFFRETGSGIFELRSFAGPGALLLPQLITGAHDIWHQGSSTWFDRTADLRVLLTGGATPVAYNPNGGYVDVAAAGPAITPAVWARGSGAWLDRDASAKVNAFGRNYQFDLGRDLEVMDWQMGLDLGHRDLMAPGDILVFGVLGGFVGADLDYDQLVRQFDFEGVQVGGYATYLRGGLFVDTLLNAHLLEMETATGGFPSSLDATTLGLRTDTGYRFGSFSGGPFLEPLATIAVLWSDIDGFTSGGNKVAFDDEANVRGRLGLRAGTSYSVWTGTTMEPFVIGSLWGNLSGDNQATLSSNGTNFRFEDDLDDVWGEVSAGVNFFNPSAGTAVFAKIDVTFGDDVDGIGGKAGMRVNW